MTIPIVDFYYQTPTASSLPLKPPPLSHHLPSDPAMESTLASSSHHTHTVTNLCERPSGLVKVVIEPGFRGLCDDVVRSSCAAQLRYVFG